MERKAQNAVPGVRTLEEKLLEALAESLKQVCARSGAVLTISFSLLSGRFKSESLFQAAATPWRYLKPRTG